MQTHEPISLRIDTIPDDPSQPVTRIVHLAGPCGGPFRFVASATIDPATGGITEAASQGDEGAKALPDVIADLKRLHPTPGPSGASGEEER